MILMNTPLSGLATFFNTFVNPIALEDIQWKYLITYVVWLAYEVCFVYFFFPETHGRTLEELAFRKSTLPLDTSQVDH
jgi:hypothetical protein